MQIPGSQFNLGHDGWEYVGIDGLPYQLVVTLTACYQVEIC